MEKVTKTKSKNQKALQGKKRCQMCGNMLRLSKFADHQARRCRFKYLRGTVYETLPEGVRWRQHLPWLSHVSGSPRREGNPPLIAPGREVPQWLRDIETAGELPLSLPLHDILAASCFYPASGIDDTSPILLANGYVHSFVYADYGIKREDLLRRIHWMPLIEGYELLMERDVAREEIAPPGLSQEHAQHQFRDERGAYERKQREEERLERRRGRHQDEEYRRNNVGGGDARCPSRSPVWRERIETLEHYFFKGYEQFGHWSVWRRKEGEHPSRGPELFSFLFMALEGGAACECLYVRTGTSPEVLAIIQPGHAMGFNFECFYDQEFSCLWGALKNCSELPRYLIAGENRGMLETWSYVTSDCEIFDFTGYVEKFYCHTEALSFYMVSRYVSNNNFVIFGKTFPFNHVRAWADLGVNPSSEEGIQGWLLWIQHKNSELPKMITGWMIRVYERSI